jgi:hypothetical protein
MDLTGIERPLLVAHYDNTEIWINGDSNSGNLLTTLNAGEYLSIEGEITLVPNL